MLRAKIQQKNESPLLRLYAKFEPLAEKYAWRIYRSQKIGYEYEDLVQEFKMKIYLSLIAYARYYERKKGTPYEPWPVEIYIKKALANKTTDFIKQINETPNQQLSVEADGFDYSEFGSMESHIVWSRDCCKCEINGVDLLAGLGPTEAKCFMLYLRGYTLARLRKIFQKSVPNAVEIIQNQVQYLQEFKLQLLENTITKYTKFIVESDN